MRHLHDKRRGNAYQYRSLVDTNNANQWIQTPKQQRFIELWLNPSSVSFSNAYRSALNAGYSESYARKITARYTGLKWISDSKRSLSKLQPNDIILELQFLALSGSQDRDRLTALDKLARIQGMYSRSPQVKDIKFVNDVPRPINNG